MRHKRIALFALSAALLLSGCNMDKAATTTADTTAVTEEVTTTTTAEVTTTTAASATTSAETTVKTSDSTELRKRLIEYGYDPDVTYYLLDGTEFIFPPMDEWSEESVMNSDAASYYFRSDLPTGMYEGFYFINGTVFLRSSTGDRFSEKDDPEQYKKYVTKSPIEWKAVNVGEKYGSLTLEKAFSFLTRYFSQNDDGSKTWLCTDTAAVFSDSVELEGLIYHINDDPMGSGLYFDPSPQSMKEKDFPMLSNHPTLGNICYYAEISSDGETSYRGDTVSIDLGDCDEAVKKKIFDTLGDNSYLKVCATVTDVRLHGWIESEDQGRYCDAVISDFEVIG